MQQMMGITYDPSTLLFHEHTLALAGRPDAAFFDWMHNWRASSGVAQYHLNEFIRIILMHGITLTQLDEYTVTIVQPKSHTKLGKRFFEDRYVAKPGKHFRAFSGEMLTAVQIIGQWSDAVFAPLHIADPHVDAFNLLRNILDLLTMGTEVLPRLDLLRRLLQSHHDKYLTLYPGCAKPKLHYARHLPDDIQRWQALLSCWAPERKHKHSKQLGNSCYKSMVRTMLSYDTRAFYKRILDPNIVEPYFLRPPVRDQELADGRVASCSRMMSTPSGTFSRGVLLLWVEGGRARVGFVNSFQKFPGLVSAFFAVVARVHGQPGDWGLRAVSSELVLASSIRRALAFQKSGERVRALLPTVL
jgi:hypothetical protein